MLPMGLWQSMFELALPLLCSALEASRDEDIRGHDVIAFA